MTQELERRIDKVEHDVGLVKMDIVGILTRLAVAESNINDIKEDLSSIKQNTTWIIRLIVGAIILAVIGFITTTGGK